VNELGLEKHCLARIHTYGKALGAHGAAVICSADLKDFLINYSRPFIFSTALPFHSLAAIKCAYKFLPQVDNRRDKLRGMAKIFNESFSDVDFLKPMPSGSPIQSIVVSGNANAKALAIQLQEKGFDVRPILYPTVPKGKERIRVCLHSYNSEEEVIKLAETIKALEGKAA
jgi:8-amino-7-oxononanoate synthase